jgi:hypothetical protein
MESAPNWQVMLDRTLEALSPAGFKEGITGILRDHSDDDAAAGRSTSIVTCARTWVVVDAESGRRRIAMKGLTCYEL